MILAWNIEANLFLWYSPASMALAFEKIQPRSQGPLLPFSLAPGDGKEKKKNNNNMDFIFTIFERPL